MCLYPTLRNNPKYKPNKKNGGIIPPVFDPRVLYVPTGCGNCIECRKQKAREWKTRLLEDIKANRNGKFITLTFSNESIQKLTKIVNSKINTRWKLKKYRHSKKYYTPIYTKPDLNILNNIVQLSGYALDNAIATLAVRRFLERWRKKHTTSLRHWLVTELGHEGTENIHLHGLIWTDEPIEVLDKYWQYGFTWKGKYNTRTGKYYQYVNGRTIGYVVKYVHKMDFIHKTYKQIILNSPGVGANYQGKHNKYNGPETDTTYRTETGHKIALPTYWRNKIYTDEEKEKLWIQQLDKNERYVLGERIDISKDDTSYIKQVEAARKTNKALGYGDSGKDYNRLKYEHERRKILQETRIRNNNKKKK